SFDSSIETKLASTSCDVSIVTRQSFEPLHAPDHALNFDPGRPSGCRATVFPLSKQSPQAGGHVMPGGSLVTVPLPSPDVATRSVALPSLARKVTCKLSFLCTNNRQLPSA